MKFTIVDKSFFNRCIARCIFPSATVVSNIKSAVENYDFGVLSTPPSHQYNIYATLQRNVARLLVEKPIRVELRHQDVPGYVMVHHPLVVTLRTILSRERVVSVEVNLDTNIDFNNDLGGWRSGKDGSLKSEFFSHVASLAAFCTDGNEINSAEHDFQVIQDSVNTVRCKVKLNDCEISLNLHGAQKVRKASYQIRCTTEDYFYFCDMYKIERGLGSECLRVIDNITGSAPNNFYLRGFEYSNQIDFFLSQANHEVNFSRINKLVHDWENRLD